MDNPDLALPAEELVSAPKTFPGILAAIGWIVLYFMLQGLLTAIILVAATGRTNVNPTDNPASIIWGLMASAIVQLGLMSFYLRKDGRLQQIGLTHFGRISFGRATGLAVMLVVAAMIFNYLYANFAIPGIGMQEDMAKMLASIPRTPLNMAAGFVAIAIAAPVVEELLFRGLLQNALAKYMPIWGAIIGASFLFSLVHLQPYAIPGLMSLSIAFGYLYHRTGSLRTNIILHMANNAMALLLTQSIG